MASAPPRSSRPLEGREFLAPGWLEARASAPRALPGGAPPPFLPLALGPYRIRRRIGAGGMGVVYEAFDTRKNERVALKTLELMDASGLYRLKNEFRSVADITHPNLVSLYELVCEGSTWFITMELVEGVSFLDYVSEGAAPRGAGPAPGAYGGAGAEETLRSGSGLHTAAPCSHARQIPARPDELPTQDRDPSRTDAARTVRSEPPPGMKGARVPAGALRGWERAAQGITSEPPPASAHRPSHARIRRALLQLASAVST
ncbi:MAG: protein kinase, partial [Polyangiaceae bacterium]|nr:protein kinase [Polyangiaceae bacterium]